MILYFCSVPVTSIACLSIQGKESLLRGSSWGFSIFYSPFKLFFLSCASPHPRRILILGGSGGVGTFAIQVRRKRSCMLYTLCNFVPQQPAFNTNVNMLTLTLSQQCRNKQERWWYGVCVIKRFQTSVHTSLGDLNNGAHITQMSHLISLIIHSPFFSNIGNTNIVSCS